MANQRINSYLLLEQIDGRDFVLGHASSHRTVERELNRIQENSKTSRKLKIEAVHEPLGDIFIWIADPE